MTPTTLVAVFLILAGLAVLALLLRYLARLGPAAVAVRLDELPAVLEQAGRSLAGGAAISADTVQAIQTTLESFTRAFRLRSRVPVMAVPPAVRRPARRRG